MFRSVVESATVSAKVLIAVVHFNSKGMDKVKEPREDMYRPANVVEGPVRYVKAVPRTYRLDYTGSSVLYVS